jgi:hypothetical protein
MIYDGELTPYFGREKVAPFVEVYSILMQAEGFTFSIPTAKRDALIRFAMGYNLQSSRIDANYSRLRPMPTQPFLKCFQIPDNRRDISSVSIFRNRQLQLAADVFRPDAMGAQRHYDRGREDFGA